MTVYKDAKKVTVDEITYIEVSIDGIISVVPENLGNRHYNEIQELVSAGELTIAAAD